MPDKKNNEKGGSHLRLVGKDEAREKAPGTSVMDIESISEQYTKIAMETTGMFLDAWDEYTEDGMERDCFRRTLLEIDEAAMVHPVIAFDTSPGPAAKDQALAPANYGILDLAKLTAEDEDRLLWDFEARGAGYRIAFIPLRAVSKLEKLLHSLVKTVIKENKKLSDPEAAVEPIATIGYVREVVILFHNLYSEFSIYDDDFDFDEDFDEDFDGDLDGDFDGDENDFWFEEDEPDWSPEVKEEFEKRVAEELENLRLNRISVGQYAIISR